MDIIERLTKLLQCDEVKVFAQKSILDELKSVGVKASSALEFVERHCIITDDVNIPGTTPAARLVSMLENLHQEAAENPKQMKYVVATQDKDLRLLLGAIPGVPLVYFNKVTLVLEPPSETSKRFSQKLEHKKVSLKESEVEILEHLVVKSGPNIIGVNSETAKGIDVPSAAPVRIKRKAISANPLSHRPPSADSNNTKRRKVQKYKR